MDKLHEYQGFAGRWHEWRSNARQWHEGWRERHPGGVRQYLKDTVLQGGTGTHTSAPIGTDAELGGRTGWNENAVDFSHIYRRKTRLELIRISAAVMGIEFSYAAETAFVSPTLLKIGVEHQHMTLVWCLSPLVGFFLTPVLGSLSDRCRSKFGRRRPFIMLLSLGVLLGLLLVPNGEDVGYAMGDFNPYAINTTLNSSADNTFAGYVWQEPQSNTIKLHSLEPMSQRTATIRAALVPPDIPEQRPRHPWGIFFTILGTVLLDFDADACQSPARAFLLDVTVPEDHARGLSTFTIMAGLGGFMGYSLGGIDWDNTSLGIVLGGHVRAVFSLITIIFIVCVLCTVTSFSEIPLWILEEELERQDPPMATGSEPEPVTYGATLKHDHSTDQPPTTSANYDELPGENFTETSFNLHDACKNSTNDDAAIAGNMKREVEETGGDTTGQEEDKPAVTLSMYLLSIVYMPHSLRMVCLTNLFCWMAHVCYSLYFTDFVGEAVFDGDPKALDGTEKYMLYEAGVRFGCWGMAMYSLSCACYSLIIERLIKRFRAKSVYVGGLLFYCVGMSMMALSKHRVGVIVFSWTAGVMYSTLFTMPYLLVAHYHSEGVFEVNECGVAKQSTGAVRGLGTDVAIVSSMVFLAQFVLSICMGSIVAWTGTTTAVVTIAAMLSFCGALSATQIMYLNL
ncbi:solute carrier family 45 member 4 isoform X2 [Anopheles stephensi]|uniref:Major facilitator superfamily associated domain-containing protein n=2 Tax=Anopheles stephensi TaxID=30069 RepID=A0A182YR91_ANOST|nr:solute carrier family 45 member 4 isoform X2 [Anopheles stephensi]XP_035915026.1 solute carrier family 45 member 4 isoform X2 [Anopheles stephensi]XP_035915031.1 solute carrier family 45 member 4 isoform X2 [Anopheles stephensi]XP_035915042.1 solute carrier family 45 member 4 isoform X2 [Anopheles stephensi]XP_035915051.1 solute carrier family 45 member 4 isoform X2 [Anopheles stephensi]XP_035915061.1 solute carrier family 45 member 4 isoform X2 [Anopheles stephensi]